MSEEDTRREGEEEKGFKVSDRRFAVRGYVEEEPEAEEKKAPAELPKEAAQAPPSPRAAEQQPPPEAAQSPAPENPAEPGEDEPDSRLFEMLIAIMQGNALAAMGIHPQTGERVGAPDPRSARMFVDVFKLLREKTRGNLSPQEESLIEQVHSDLQMIYVQQVGIG